MGTTQPLSNYVTNLFMQTLQEEPYDVSLANFQRQTKDILEFWDARFIYLFLRTETLGKLDRGCY